MRPATMKEIIATLPTVEQRTEAARLAIELWNPGDKLADTATVAVAMVLEGSLRE